MKHLLLSCQSLAAKLCVGEVAFAVREGWGCVGANSGMVHGCVSGWFGLSSVGGQAPVQIKDFSVKVPDSAPVCKCSPPSFIFLTSH